MVLLKLLLIAQGAVAQLSELGSISETASVASYQAPSLRDAGEEGQYNDVWMGCVGEAYKPVGEKLAKLGWASSNEECRGFCSSEFTDFSWDNPGTSWYNPVNGECTCGYIQDNPTLLDGDPMIGCNGNYEVYLQTINQWFFQGCWESATFQEGTWYDVESLSTAYACDTDLLMFVAGRSGHWQYSCFTIVDLGDPIHCNPESEVWLPFYVYSVYEEGSVDWPDWNPDGSPSTSASSSPSPTPSASDSSSSPSPTPSPSDSSSSSPSPTPSPSASSSSASSSSSSSRPPRPTSGSGQCRRSVKRSVQ